MTHDHDDTRRTPVLKALLESAAGAPLPDWPRAQAAIDVVNVAAGGTVFMQGVVHPYVYAVVDGLVKLVYLRENGDAWVKSFSWEGRYFASIAALVPGGRTSFMVSALEATRLERIDHRVVQALARQHLAWAHAASALTMAFAARKEARERELLTLTAEARYRTFADDYPELLPRIAQKDLARYLGVTAVGLNRIAMRVRKAEVEGTAPRERSA